MNDPAAASTIKWLMEGDPSIRRQTMRDLLDPKPPGAGHAQVG